MTDAAKIIAQAKVAARADVDEAADQLTQAKDAVGKAEARMRRACKSAAEILSTGEIAEITGASRGNVSKWIREADIDDALAEDEDEEGQADEQSELPDEDDDPEFPGEPAAETAQLLEDVPG